MAVDGDQVLSRTKRRPCLARHRNSCIVADVPANPRRKNSVKIDLCVLVVVDSQEERIIRRGSKRECTPRPYIRRTPNGPDDSSRRPRGSESTRAAAPTVVVESGVHPVCTGFGSCELP